MMSDSIVIGPYALDGFLALAPMSGVTDLPFREVCRQFGANYLVSEMVDANPAMRHKRGSDERTQFLNDALIPRVVQIVGHCPYQMAETAAYQVERGAQIIDINMGCPAKKVTKKLAGSALLAEPAKVEAIISHVVDAVNVPVTLKIRTGVSRLNKNGVDIAQMAESLGIQAIAVHGRTQKDLYKGEAEYDTIAEIVSTVKVPVWANGDINKVEDAKKVIDYTGAKGLMIGRGAQGRPWFFQQIRQFFSDKGFVEDIVFSEQMSTCISHIRRVHEFYPTNMSVCFARKHLGWYAQYWQNGDTLRKRFNRLTSMDAQIQCLQAFESEKE